MKEYVIVTDSCADLPYSYVEENKIPFARLTCLINGREIVDDFGKSYPFIDFYEHMKKGLIPKTSQPSSHEFYQMFKDIVRKGKDIVYVAVSTGLSGTLNSANVAKNTILEEYPDCNIQIVDILTASLGQGIMVRKALELQKQGKTMEDVVDYLEEKKKYLNTYIIVNDLIHLKRGGRISAAAAAIGCLLNIKPMITISNLGKVLTIGKIRGRKKALNELILKTLQRINEEHEYVAISHADCIEDALYLKQAIEKQVKVKEFIINYIGPVVGSFGGPGAIAVFFYGLEREKQVEI